MDFLNTYQTYTNTELLRIIANAHDYQPLAVQAARMVIDSRQLSEEELQSAKEALNDSIQTPSYLQKKTKH